MMNLNNNPAIAAYYFQKCWQIFYQEVVKPQLDVVDHWWRFEWQHRGSSHIHGFLWLKHAPPVEDLKLDDDQSVHQFVIFQNRLVSTWNPMPTHPLHLYIPLHNHLPPSLTLNKSWLNLSIVFSDMLNALPTVCAVITPQRKRSADFTFHRMCVNLQS